MSCPTSDAGRSDDAGPAARTNPADLFIEHLELIETVIADVMRHETWRPDDADDFRSKAFLRLLEHDCRILRRHQGRASMRTYLSVVITNFLRDFRNARYGKWRPSRASVRLGRLAVELDRLMNRDRAPRHEAVREVAARDDCHLTEEELLDMAERIPQRARRRNVPLEAATGVRSETTADGRVMGEDAESRAAALTTALEACLAELEDEDQVVLRLRFWNGMTVAEIARTLGLEQKPLYRRIERCMKRLQEHLKDLGVTATDVAAAVAGD